MTVTDESYDFLRAAHNDLLKKCEKLEAANAEYHKLEELLARSDRYIDPERDQNKESHTILIKTDDWIEIDGQRKKCRKMDPR